MNDDVKKVLEKLTLPPEAAIADRVTVMSASKLTVKDLKTMVESNPNHPASIVYAKAIKDYPDHHIMVVEDLDIEGIATNRVVYMEETYIREKNQFIRMKKLGDEILVTPKKTPKKKTPPKEKTN